MKNFIFILGGVRSGKSSYAVRVAKSFGKKIAFIATGVAFDAEMKKRISLHKKNRPASWRLIEEQINIDSILARLNKNCDAVLIDCLGLFIWNLMEKKLTDKLIEKKLHSLIREIKKCEFPVIVVSNEVGMGIVPDNHLSRRFCDLLGRANQIFAKYAQKVIIMHAGIPLIIKDKKDEITK
ncbi:MAG: bifunctional adenosylcobinamide kinase/adenosylcobinamide-phosphate guanylyltransferase [Candidatus Omnitrophica bacterium]|nr:bifunctional adenosylcobinamide kinase/adenosylcobinamide-phosphate guanylyltransferase [Candidatus Omnitrophota bacterium]MCM8826442.1 bifunctional adenosylcobinamide kinase/adenosylcobinamide-phosphate guanylyltransferase [Candidatus Omnitrophota bacterium]